VNKPAVTASALNRWLGAPAFAEAADTAPDITADSDLTEGTLEFEARESRPDGEAGAEGTTGES